MRVLVALGIALTVAGCGLAGVPSSTPSGSLNASHAAGPAQSSCQDIDLRLPSGRPLDLTGTWHGNDGSYWTFTQARDCVWATTTDRYPLEGAPENFWQIYLRGSLLQDFTMPVEFAYSPLSDAPGSSSGFGHAILSVDLPAEDSSESLTLRKTAGCLGGEPDVHANACPPGEASLQTTTWTLVSPEVILPPPTPEP